MGLRIVVGWPKEGFVPTALLVWLNILPSHKKTTVLKVMKTMLRIMVKVLKKQLEFQDIGSPFRNLKGLRPHSKERAKTPNPNFTLTAVVRPSWRFHFASDRSMVRKIEEGFHDKGYKNYFTRFRPGWSFEGFPSFFPSLFNKFSLKRVFFKLTALMMQ